MTEAYKEYAKEHPEELAGINQYDNYDEFIKYLDNEAKGNDNGRNNSSLFMLYEMWQEEFNRTGAIPNGYYCSAITEHQGYTCRVYENEHHAYYVTEDNCVLYYSEKYPSRNFAYVSSITEITEIPYSTTAEVIIDKIICCRQ